MIIKEVFDFKYLVFMAFMVSCNGKQTSDTIALSDVQEARQAGLEYLDKNMLSEAEVEFTRLIELAPEEVMGYTNLGIVYLRQGELAEAEEYFKKALDLDAENLTVRLNLFEVYQQMDQQEMAVSQLQKILELDPDNLFALYKMSEKSQAGQGGAMTTLNEYLTKIIEVAPTNIVPRIYLIEHLLENRRVDNAMEQFEEIQSKFERLPEETQVLFDQAYEDLRNSRVDDAYTSLIMFHNQLKLTNWYQADIRALRGSEYSQIGIPVISFSRKMTGYGSEENNLVYQNIRYNDVAENAGLAVVDNHQNSFITINDLDNDGDQDLFLGTNSAINGQGFYMFSNELGRFDQVFKSSGIKDYANVHAATFADYDNDGFLDLFFIADGFMKLYHNVNAFEYEDVTAKAAFDNTTQGIVPLFFDADHDGDLDLFIGTNGLDQLYQNNGDGSFTNISNQAGIEGPESPTYDVTLGDFDDDGDIDFFVVNENGNRLYSNSRMGKYEDITASSGLAISETSTSVSSGDFNNDGFLDLFITDHSGQYKLYKNMGVKGFVEVPEIRSTEGLSALKPHTHEFFDYDNDGWLDLVLAGDPQADGARGMIILRNNQQNFENVSWSLPEPLDAINALSIGDYNEDNDLDIFVSYRDGNIGLLRNDGGNMNYQLKIQLVGLRQGSGKNNYYGIGSKVEVRAGSLYQMRTITSPSEYFGLGNNERADILRIRWTNGVPQNIFSPHSDLDLIEQQKLKGSCPFLYTWNGEKYVFVKDIMWRSALGMPLGIMTSDDSRSYAFSDASREYLKIPAEMLKPKDGKYNIKITGELWETIFLDQIELFAVDHPDTIDIHLDEKFVLPPFPELKLYPIKEHKYPVSVTDGQNDHLNKIQKKDNVYISNFKRSEYQGITGLKDLIIDLGKGTATENLYLLLNGWIFPSDASINVAVSQSSQANMVPPYLQVKNARGEWETVDENLGFPLGKNKTMVVDLSGLFLTDDRSVRIRTSLQIYWDHIFYTYIDEPFQGNLTPLMAQEANLQFRGFSEEFRKGDRNGPHWFDYNKTTTEPKWMDLKGSYTRFGDVLPLLDSADNQYIIYNAGDEVSISYYSDGLPELPEGWSRDFVIYSVGWVKDGDLNTAYGQTVAPLPFHGMSSYPYRKNEAYPYQENSEYINKYNTRKVDNQQFRDLLKVSK